MIKSMTGYGRAQRETEGHDITVELRSVNHRYLDVNIRIGRIYSFLEETVKALVQKSINRGKVDIFITIDNSKSQQAAISLNKPILEGYLDAFNELCSEYGIENNIKASDVLRIPDVFTVKKLDEDTEQLKAELTAVVTEALENHASVRASEGAEMEEDILLRCDYIENTAAEIDKRSEETVGEYRERLYQRMVEILGATGIDEQRILQEAALYADRVAVSEETVRLKSHLSQLRQMISQGGAIGRKMDFYVQELNREVNTIGSKASDIAIAKMVVDLKAEIEKIREQAQNIE